MREKADTANNSRTQAKHLNNAILRLLKDDTNPELSALSLGRYHPHPNPLPLGEGDRANSKHYP